jgi:hypothetical protein
MAATPELLPPPQQVTWTDGELVLPRTVQVSVPPRWSSRADSYLWLLDESLALHGGQARLAPDGSKVGIRIDLFKPDGMAPGGYGLEIQSTGIEIRAPDPAGMFNAMATLSQMIEQAVGTPLQLPTCRIRDWPEMPIRAVHIDLTCQQYNARYIQDLMRTLARYKVNAVLMEYSGMFPFRKHAEISRPDAYSEEEIVAIRRTAAACNVELIPFLQCLGHLEYVLQRKAYSHLGHDHAGYMYCPVAEETMSFVQELIDEILAQHPNLRLLHVGGDEVSPGTCEACRTYTDKHDFSSLYIKHYTQVAEYCRRRGITPLMWTDMVLKHPEGLPELPRNVSWVLWDYSTTKDPTPSLWHGANMNNLDDLKPEYREIFGPGIGLNRAEERGGFEAFAHARGFQQLGFKVYTASAARAGGDTFNLPRYKLRMGNIRLACLKAAEFKLPGTMVTSWSYRGSPHEVCLPEYASVAYGWNTKTPDVKEFLGRFFRQRYGIDNPVQLAQTVLAGSHIVPPSTVALPTLDDEKRAWLMTAEAQWEQVKHFADAGGDQQVDKVRAWLDHLSRGDETWAKALCSASRHQRELKYWDLSRRHLIHRLRLLVPLIRILDAKKTGQRRNLDFWRNQLADSAERRKKLQQEWVQLYEEICTSRHLEVELYNRFGAEKDMIAKALADE